MSILIPVMKAKVEEEREKRILKEELGRRLGIRGEEGDGKGNDGVVDEADSRVD